MKFGCVIQNERRRGWMACGSFFGGARNKGRNRVHRKRIARIKHRGRGCNNDRREGKREIERGIRYTKPRKIIGKNRHVINGCWKSGENERRTSEWLRKTSKSVYVHSTHARRRRRRVL